MKTLLPDINGASQTNLKQQPFGATSPSRAAAQLPSRVVSNPVPFTTVAGQPLLLVQANDARVGLIIQNLDSSATIFVGFRLQADATQLGLIALQTLLLDFVCPTDSISVFCLTAVQGMLLEFSRQ